MSEAHGYHEEEALGKAYDAVLMRRLLTYLRPYRGQVALSVVLLVASSVLELAGPWLTKIAIDEHILKGDFPGLARIALLFLAAILGTFVLGFVETILMQRIGQEIMFDLRRQIFARLQRLSIAFFDRNPVGRLITRVTSDVEVVNEMFTSGVVAIFGDALTLAGILVVLLAMNWKLALVTFAVLPFLFMVTQWFRKGVRESYRDVRTRVARINSFMQESFTGMSVIQVMNREEKTFDEFHALNRDHYRANMRSIFYHAIFYPSIEFLSSIAVAMVILYGGFQVVGETLTIGALAAFLQYVRRFFEPIRDLAEKYNILQSSMASSERIFKLLDSDSFLPRPSDPAPLPTLRVPVEFRNVSFAYKEDHEVLHDVSFSIAPGESLAIVGATGAGKTTIINLLCRFYDVTKGEVRIGGRDIRAYDPRELRKRIGLVLQDIYLFSGTIEENLRLGDESIPVERVRGAAATVNAERFIRRLEGGFDAKVRERGSSLSMGERQLLSFARALAHDPDLLILDEATSSVDTETEILIQDALRKLLRGRTSIVIAHRLSTIQSANRILVLHKGQVREIGTHQELLAARGIYYRLYQLQYKDQEVAVAAGVSGDPGGDGGNGGAGRGGGAGGVGGRPGGTARDGGSGGDAGAADEPVTAPGS